MSNHYTETYVNQRLDEALAKPPYDVFTALNVPEAAFEYLLNEIAEALGMSAPVLLQTLIDERDKPTKERLFHGYLVFAWEGNTLRQTLLTIPARMRAGEGMRAVANAICAWEDYQKECVAQGKGLRR